MINFKFIDLFLSIIDQNKFQIQKPKIPIDSARRVLQNDMQKPKNLKTFIFPNFYRGFWAISRSKIIRIGYFKFFPKRTHQALSIGI